jgi:hypothetical protein
MKLMAWNAAISSEQKIRFTAARRESNANHEAQTETQRQVESFVQDATNLIAA